MTNTIQISFRVQKILRAGLNREWVHHSSWKVVGNAMKNYLRHNKYGSKYRWRVIQIIKVKTQLITTPIID